MIDRMPPLDPSRLDDAQRRAAQALIDGPRKGVFGPFVPLLRSPELMDRLQRVGEYLRFDNAIPARLNELAIAITARHAGNAFEWAVHRPLAARAGVSEQALDAIAAGERPAGMPEDDALVHDFVAELLRTHFVSDALYAVARERFGERGIVDLVGTVGYFLAISLVMNVAGTPAPAGS
ncbi:MAG TPA: carboxymuconolactone decarboxylase family protein [Usitatibacter sp.]|nr:carboxymuconolactone decarboxylase family protein [Usitatibacter sp.]